jgi:hypothetical protein
MTSICSKFDNRRYKLTHEHDTRSLHVLLQNAGSRPINRLDYFKQLFLILKGNTLLCCHSVRACVCISVPYNNLMTCTLHHLKDLGVDGMIILQWIVTELWDEGVDWIHLAEVGSSGGPL